MSNAEASRYDLYRPARPAAAAGWTLQTLRAPARLFGPNGIRIGPDGRLWITEVVGDHITAWDPEIDELSVVSPMGSILSGPDDLAFDSGGSVYVSETLNGRVSTRRPDGECVVLMDVAPGANGITVDQRNDTLYVNEMREGGRVLEVDRFTPNQFRVVVEGLDWLNAMETGPDGRLYMPQVLLNRIISVDPRSGDWRVEVEEVDTPTAVKFGPDGWLWTSEAGAGRMLRIDLATKRREVAATAYRAIDNFCFDAAGNLYVSNFIEVRLARYAAGEDRVDRVLSDGGLMGPYQIALDGDSLVVADVNSVARIGGGGDVERLSRLLIDMPFVAVGIAAADRGFMVLSLGGEVFHFDPTGGGMVKVVAAHGDATDQLLSITASGISALGTAGGGRVLAGRVGGGEVVVLARDGQMSSPVDTGLSGVSGVAGSDEVTVACDATQGVVAVASGGEVRRIDGFDRPDAVAVDGDTVYVAERGARQVTRVGLDGTGRAVVATDLPFGFPQPGKELGRSSALLLDRDGSLLVGCDGDGSIRRLRRA